MKTYQIIAMFDYPEINRSTHVTAIDKDQAIIRAVVGNQIPVCFHRDTCGNLQARYWQDISSHTCQPWPQIKSGNRLIWTEGSHQKCLRFDILETDK